MRSYACADRVDLSSTQEHRASKDRRGQNLCARRLRSDPSAAADKCFAFKPPKSGKLRSVAVPAFVADAFRRHRAKQNEDRLRMGPVYHTSPALAIAAETGEPLHPPAFTSAFRQALKTAGLPDAGPHTLRHTCATLSTTRVRTRSLSARRSATTIQGSRCGGTGTRCRRCSAKRPMRSMRQSARR